MISFKSNTPMKQKLSGIVLAVEIGAIVLLHTFKLTHQEKNDGQRKIDVVSSHQIKISNTYSYTSFR